MAEENKENPESLSRRKFIRNTSYTVGAFAYRAAEGILKYHDKGGQVV